MKTKSKKPINPHARRNMISTRFSNAELQEVLKRAHVYEHGNVSEYLRVAALNFKREHSK